MFLLIAGCDVRSVLGNQSARGVDHVHPIAECMGEVRDKILQRPLLETIGCVEAVVGHVTEIGFRLLHYGHVEEDGRLPDLMISAETADAAGRNGNNCRRLLVERTLSIRP